ncbi:MAG: AAA family ATPase [Euryarchaeota archaeon]|nr:AAA family ATPase [Euryarchaeota archaeon]
MGDPRQLHAVEAGNPLAAIVRDGAPTAVIGEVQRQRDEDLKAVVESFARGEAGWGALRASGHFVFSEDIARSAAQDYLTRSREERERTLVLCGTNATREAINEQVRLGLRLEGALGPDVKVRTLRRQDLTREELRRPSSYAPGDIVVPQRDHGARRTPSALERGVEYRVVEVRGETVDLENRVTGERSSWEPSKAAGVHLYREERTTLAEGDRVVFRENSRDLGAVNGDRGTVTRIGDHDLTVHLDRGRNLVMDRDFTSRNA